MSDLEVEVIDCIVKMFKQQPLYYDAEKLEYNSKYKNIEFFENKFPEGYDCSWFYPVVKLCREESLKKKLTPLKEIDTRLMEASER